MKEKNNKQVFLQTLFLSLIVMTVAFIWRNSMLGRAASSGESNAVRGWLENFISYDNVLGAFLLRNLRKVAHFAEFALLGAETAGYVKIVLLKSFRSVRTAVSQLSFGLLIASADEFIQIFTGRGASVKDVLLDFSGYLAGTLFCIFLCLLFSLRKTVCKY